MPADRCPDIRIGKAVRAADIGLGTRIHAVPPANARFHICIGKPPAAADIRLGIGLEAIPAAGPRPDIRVDEPSAASDPGIRTGLYAADADTDAEPEAIPLAAIGRLRRQGKNRRDQHTGREAEKRFAI
ncbi:hypothetical protein GCM10007923_42390 [Shinella yambaruensis]|uniref:Uncharacterized protein n=1 Tax=Shinella yambaruensis TaxID=415996 RepID=A0ABQ5ZJP0_9HYPH|nr:hypothetical protein GCM10007923_42390 [Shinella yambaruensis]